MNPAHQNHHSAATRSTPVTPPSPGAVRPRATRKLFRVEARPLDNTAPGGAALRALRRSRSWLTLLFVIPCLVLAADETPTNAPDPSGMPVPVSEPADDIGAELPPVQLDPETITAIATNVAAALSAQAVAPTNPPAAAPVAPRPPAPAPAPAPAAQRSRNDEPSRTSEPRSGDRANREESRSSTRSSPGQAPSAPDFSAYRIITERNIFDPNRNPRRSNNAPRPRPKTVDSLALVGIMSYEKGIFAFFDGTRGDFKKAVQPAGQIAGFKVASVTPDAVRLTSGDRHYDLKVGMQLRREEDGPWETSSQSASFASAPSSTPGPAAPSQGNSPPPQAAPPSTGNSSADEVLKRLMQRREQE